jgi:hypothetical protein
MARCALARNCLVSKISRSGPAAPTSRIERFVLVTIPAATEQPGSSVLTTWSTLSASPVLNSLPVIFTVSVTLACAPSLLCFVTGCNHRSRASSDLTYAA